MTTQSPAGRVFVETPRLLLREFTDGDASFVVRLLNEPSWLRFIGDRGVRTEADALRYLDGGPRKGQALHGYSLRCVVPRETGEPVGMCGLIRRDTLPDPDLGFAFLPEAWGKGYATEASRAVLDHGRDVHGMRRVLAITVPENAESIRVLERLRFRREGPTRLPGESVELLLFALDMLARPAGA